MSNSIRECADYFKKQRGYDRCFREMRKKWEIYGRVAGRIVLNDVTEEERRSLTGILGRNFYEDSVRFSMADFESALQKTRFAPITLQKLLEQYFGEAICTNQEKAADKQKQREEFWESLAKMFRSQGLTGRALEWLYAMKDTGKWGYTLLMSHYGKNPEAASLLARNVGMSLERMILLVEEQEEIPLAVLAAEMTNNPHDLDRGTPAGNLLIHAICWYKDCEYPQNAYLWRLLLLDMGIAPDNLSSFVTVYGLHLKTGSGLHPAYESFNQYGEPGVITMENMKNITGAYTDRKIAYIVENQMVFSFLMSYAEKQKTALLCTSGQLRMASQELIRMLVESDTQIYYSGDIDPEGMLIADKIWKQYPDHLHIWRMSKQDYENSVSEEKIEKKRLGMLELLQNPCLKETAQQVKRIKKAGYQENILQKFVEDLSQDSQKKS